MGIKIQAQNSVGSNATFTSPHSSSAFQTRPFAQPSPSTEWLSFETEISTLADSPTQQAAVGHSFDKIDETGYENKQNQKNKTGMPSHLKAGIETLSGISMDDVKVHYNSSQPTQLQALAYTQGTDIHVAPGQEKHLPHEAWHVVQQKQGQVKPTIQANGVSINDDKRLEQEAETMGKKAASYGLGQSIVQPAAPGGLPGNGSTPLDSSMSGVIQRKPVDLDAVLNRYKGEERSEKVLQDSIRVRDFLSQEQSFLPAIRQLEADLVEEEKQYGGANKKLGKDPFSKALSNVLSKREAAAGLGESVPIYTDILGTKAFQTMAAESRLMKDVGAGDLHGEFTHRIQWYVVLYNMSQGFTKDLSDNAPDKFNYTPADLLREINMAEVEIKEADWPKGIVEGGGHLWDAVFDCSSAT